MESWGNQWCGLWLARQNKNTQLQHSASINTNGMCVLKEKESPTGLPWTGDPACVVSRGSIMNSKTAGWAVFELDGLEKVLSMNNPSRRAAALTPGKQSASAEVDFQNLIVVINIVIVIV